MIEDTKTNFIRAFDEYSDAIFRYCLLRTGDRELSKDLVQSAFTKTWDYLYKGKEVDNMKNFIYKVASNLVIDYYRTKKAQSLEALMEDENTNFEPMATENISIEEKADLSSIFRLIREIPKEYREVVELRYVEGMSFKDIAKITKESENAARVRVHRALEKLKKIFND